MLCVNAFTCWLLLQVFCVCLRVWRSISKHCCWGMWPSFPEETTPHLRGVEIIHIMDDTDSPGYKYWSKVPHSLWVLLSRMLVYKAKYIKHMPWTRINTMPVQFTLIFPKLILAILKIWMGVFLLIYVNHFSIC